MNDVIVELEIYSTPEPIIYDGIEWIIAGFYTEELFVLKQFKKNKDYVILLNWDGGKDILLTRKIITWLTLQYDIPRVQPYDNDEAYNTAITLLSQKLSA